MSEGLKALVLMTTGLINKEEWKECYSVIEEELKEYQHHEEILNWYGLTLANFREACLLLAMLKGSGRTIHDIDKQLQVFEIIKKKPFNNVWLFYYKDYEDYYENAEYVDEKQRLTEEEWNLLKEMLLRKKERKN